MRPKQTQRPRQTKEEMIKQREKARLRRLQTEQQRRCFTPLRQQLISLGLIAPE